MAEQHAVCAESLQSCLTFSYPMDCTPSGSSVHRILQPRRLEGVAISSSINPSLLVSKPKVNDIDKMCVYQKVKFKKLS